VGRSPFSGTTTQILYAHVYEPLTIPEEVLLTLPPLLVDVLRRSLAKDPEDRYADAAQMADDLELSVGRLIAPAASGVPVERADAAEATATMANLDASAGGGAAGLRPVTQVSTVVLVPAPQVGGGSETAQGVPVGPVVRPGVVAPAPVLPVNVPPGQVLVVPPPLGVSLPAARVAEDAPRRGVRGLLVGGVLAVAMFVLLGVAVAALLGLGPFSRQGAPAAEATVAVAPTVQPVDGTPEPTGRATVVSATPAGAMAERATPVNGTPESTMPESTTPESTTPESTTPESAEPASPTPGDGTPARATPADGTPNDAASSGGTPATGGDAEGTPEVAATPAANSAAGGAIAEGTLPAPTGDIGGFWEEAQAFHTKRDWGSALSWLTLVRRIDPEFERTLVEQMLFDVYVALGTQANGRGDAELALQQFQRASELQPTNALLASLLQTTRAAAAARGDAQESARRLLQVAHAAYADQLRRDNRICDAADHLDAAARILPEERAQAAADDMVRRCVVLLEAQQDQQLLQSLGGRLVYSTQLPDGRYAIYALATTPGAQSQLLLGDARQPAVSGNGQWLAFHNVAAGQEGLARIDLGRGGDRGFERLTDGARDGADSPPTWNGAGTELVFGGTDPANGRSFVYRITAPAGGEPQVLAPGHSPAWSWALDRVAYTGVDPIGQAPGLYLMRPDGSSEGALTDNGNDIRPAWSPDGGSLLFMSSGRSASWDVYRLTLADGSVTTVTNNPAQDGLPVFSPDGRFVAWVSDRGGRWNIWVKALDASVTGGGESRELLLAPVEGSLTNWLEHSLQWIP